VKLHSQILNERDVRVADGCMLARDRRVSLAQDNAIRDVKGSCKQPVAVNKSWRFANSRPAAAASSERR